MKRPDLMLRVRTLVKLKQFYLEYREAYERLKAGIRRVIFPYGTYWFRVHAGVKCAPASTM